MKAAPSGRWWGGGGRGRRRVRVKVNTSRSFRGGPTTAVGQHPEVWVGTAALLPAVSLHGQEAGGADGSPAAHPHSVGSLRVLCRPLGLGWAEE